MRELGFRDLGGLVFDQHRFQRPGEQLVHGKVAAIDAVDRELRAIEDALGRRAPYDELFIPGVSACPRCGALHGSDARFCPNCGLAFSGPRSVASVAAPATAPAAAPAPEPFPPAPPA
ncbi:MAG: zinc ribbon domain-containing protein [Solirubrobacteraceae bacterium]|nr:zinc ribbon domain-containing protein [Solirubrobacteraceae bacterium]